MRGTNPEAEKDARLRMEARAKLIDPNRPPRFAVHFAEPPTREEVKEEMLTGFTVCDSREAVAQGGGLPETTYTRLAGESLEEFQTRVRADQPANGLPRMIIFWPVKEESAPSPET